MGNKNYSLDEIKEMLDNFQICRYPYKELEACKGREGIPVEEWINYKD